MRGSNHDRKRCTHVVAEHVLHRIVRAAQVVGPILMVMVSFLLPVQRRVLPVDQGVHRRTDARQRDRLPEHGKQHDEEDSGAAHGGNSVPDDFWPAVMGATDAVVMNEALRRFAVSVRLLHPSTGKSPVPSFACPDSFWVCWRTDPRPGTSAPSSWASP